MNWLDRLNDVPGGNALRYYLGPAYEPVSAIPSALARRSSIRRAKRLNPARCAPAMMQASWSAGMLAAGQDQGQTQ